MDTLLRAFLESLDRGSPAASILEEVGEPEPARAAESFGRAHALPALASCRAVWVPALLFSARPGFGARCLEDLAGREGAGDLRLPQRPGLPRLLGSSNVLARLLLRTPDWAVELEGDPPGSPPDTAPEPAWDAIRCAKYRGLLRVAARDLLGEPLTTSLQDLSDLADRCLVASLCCAARETGVAPPTLFALGKLGSRELNFSSDVDLLFVYTAPSEEADLERNREVARLIQHLKHGLEASGAEGFGYRVDLDLRPEGQAGVLANSVDAALAYYESFGAEWERQMLIRLRHVAGPGDAAQAFVAGIQPFVYRRAIDPGVLQHVRGMKLRIEEERRQAGRALERDLKEGPGGIRDVEFLVQALQLFFGGRHPELRSGNVLQSLAALGVLRLLPEETVEELSASYTWLRRTEHAVQLAEERQTQEFPEDPSEQVALARRLGYRDPPAAAARERLLEDWSAVRTGVRRHFDALVLGEQE